MSDSRKPLSSADSKQNNKNPEFAALLSEWKPVLASKDKNIQQDIETLFNDENAAESAAERLEQKIEGDEDLEAFADEFLNLAIKQQEEQYKINDDLYAFIMKQIEPYKSKLQDDFALIYKGRNMVVPFLESKYLAPGLFQTKLVVAMTQNEQQFLRNSLEGLVNESIELWKKTQPEAIVKKADIEGRKEHVFQMLYVDCQAIALRGTLNRSLNIPASFNPMQSAPAVSQNQASLFAVSKPAGFDSFSQASTPKPK